MLHFSHKRVITSGQGGDKPGPYYTHRPTLLMPHQPRVISGTRRSDRFARGGKISKTDLMTIEAEDILASRVFSEEMPDLV
jgi:hypothetical protein